MREITVYMYTVLFIYCIVGSNYQNVYYKIERLPVDRYYGALLDGAQHFAQWLVRVALHTCIWYWRAGSTVTEITSLSLNQALDNEPLIEYLFGL